MVRIGNRDVAPNDLGVLAAGLLLFIASFLDWYKLGDNGFVGASENAWGVGFFAFAGVELGLLVVALVALRAFAPARLPTVPLGWEMVITVISGLGTLLILLKLAVGMNVLGTGNADFNPAVGLWLGLASSVILTALCGLTLAMSRGWSFPSRPQHAGHRGGPRPTGPQHPGGYGPPPPGGYAPPPGYGQPPQGDYGQPPQGGYSQPPQAGYNPPPPGGYGPPPAAPPSGGYGPPPPAGPPPPGGYGQPPESGADADQTILGGRSGYGPPPPPPPSPPSSPPPPLGRYGPLPGSGSDAGQDDAADQTILGGRSGSVQPPPPGYGQPGGDR